MLVTFQSLQFLSTIDRIAYGDIFKMRYFGTKFIISTKNNILLFVIFFMYNRKHSRKN